MSILIFLVQGSQPTPYEVRCSILDGVPIMTCSCAAAQNGFHCKHRLNLLDGDISAVIDGNLDSLSAFSATIKETPLAALWAEIQELEAKKKTLERTLKSRKKHLGLALVGRF